MYGLELDEIVDTCIKKIFLKEIESSFFQSTSKDTYNVFWKDKFTCSGSKYL